MGHGPHRHNRIVLTWLLLAVVTASALSVGLCAVLLPDRAPSLLQTAPEVSEVPVSIQEYAGSRQVTVIPTMSKSRPLVGYASGIVTENQSDGGLVSGRMAYQVNGRSIVALNTATPLYRDLHEGDSGSDVLALNDELDRLGYASSAGSEVFSWHTRQGWRQLMIDQGNESDGSLLLEDVLWIPSASIVVSQWAAAAGTMVSAGEQIGMMPGTITRMDIKGGQASDRDLTLSVFGQATVLPAGATGVDDTAFCRSVEATDDFQALLAQSADANLSEGVDATVSLTEPVTALRVPAAAVLGLGDGESSGCVVSSGRTVPVEIVGAELGASLVVPSDGTDPASIDTVTLGSAIAGMSCS